MSLDGGQSKQQQQAHARMLLSLQKDAASARKQLLANFANYDALARRIKNLPPENYGPPEVKSSLGGKAGKEANGGDSAQERLQQAIWTRANLFLQLNVSAAPGRISPRTSAQISLRWSSSADVPAPESAAPWCRQSRILRWHAFTGRLDE